MEPHSCLSLFIQKQLCPQREKASKPPPELFHGWISSFVVPPGPGYHLQQQFSKSRVWQPQDQGTLAPARAQHAREEQEREGLGNQGPPPSKPIPTLFAAKGSSQFPHLWKGKALMALLLDSLLSTQPGP